MEPDGTIPGTSRPIAAWTASQNGTQTQAAELPVWPTAWQPPQPAYDQSFFNAAWEGLIRSWQDVLAPSPTSGGATDAFAASLSAGALPGMSPVALPSPANTTAGTGIELTFPPPTAMFWQGGG